MRTQTFFIPGPLPGENEIIKASKVPYRYGAMKRHWDNVVQWAARECKVRPLTDYAFIKCHWYEPNKRRDPDNFCAGIKFILDGLVKAKILKGDGWGCIHGIDHTWELDAKITPGVVVELKG